MPAIVLDHAQIALAAEALAPALRAAAFDGLVAVMRGGLHLAAHAAFATGLPLHFLSYSRPERCVSWHGPAPVRPRVLVCEDFAGRGHTLLDCEAFLRQGGYEVESLVICADTQSATRPRWCLFETREAESRYLLPWERHRLNPAAAAAPSAWPDHALRRTAWDLDGIFVDDVESHHYRADLSSALAQRDLLPLAAQAPQPRVGDLVITGRPESDAQRTREWCARVGLGLRIVFRNDQLPWPTPAEVAQFKARRALDEGCSDYVESDATQAALMAAAFPELRVTWWNLAQPVLLQAAALRP